jgi:hypothetical protein
MWSISAVALQQSECKRGSAREGEDLGELGPSAVSLQRRVESGARESNRVRSLLLLQCNRVITRCADTGFVPPASGVIVIATMPPTGLRTLNTESTLVVCTSAVPTI